MLDSYASVADLASPFNPRVHLQMTIGGFSLAMP